MTTELTSGYWYDEESRALRSVEVLNAMREYRTAEAAMRKRTRDSMRMNETDMVAIRFLLQAQKAGETLSPKDLSKKLGISSASTTIMIDRLEKSGHVERQPHPSDRRAIVVAPTHETDTEVRQTLSVMHERMKTVADSLTAAESDAVVRYLAAMKVAVEEND